jgi:hypothetical protein
VRSCNFETDLLLALPANPRTARGYPGNAILDEFAHHEDSYAIFAASRARSRSATSCACSRRRTASRASSSISRKEFGLADGVAPEPNPVRRGAWSWHWVDVHLAIAEGCPISVNEMRDLVKDEETFAQEFLCTFLKAVGSYIPLELIAQAEDDGATIEIPEGWRPRGALYRGIDIARDHDATIAWLDEYLGDVAWTRMVLPLYAMPFFGKCVAAVGGALHADRDGCHRPGRRAL